MNSWITLFQTISNDLSGPTAQMLAIIAVAAIGILMSTGAYQGQGAFVRLFIRFMFGIALATNAAMILSAWVSPTTIPSVPSVTSPSILPCPNPTDELACGADMAVGGIEQALKTVAGYFQQWALWIFLSLATIQLTWAGFWMMVEAGADDHFLGAFVRRIFMVSIFYGIILNANTWIRWIFDGFVFVGKTAANAATNAFWKGPGAVYGMDTPGDVSAILTNGEHLAGKAISTIGKSVSLFALSPEALVGDFLILAAAILIFLGYLMMAYELATSLIDLFLMESVGLLLLGFHGSAFTESLAQSYFPKAVSAGIKVIVILLISSAGNALSGEWDKFLSPGQGSYSGMTSIYFTGKYSSLASTLVQTNPTCLPNLFSLQQMTQNLQSMGYTPAEIQAQTLQAQNTLQTSSYPAWTVGDSTPCGMAAESLLKSLPPTTIAGMPESVLAVAGAALLFGLIAMKAPAFAANLMSSSLGGSLSGTGGALAGMAVSMAATTASLSGSVASLNKAVAALAAGKESSEKASGTLRSLSGNQNSSESGQEEGGGGSSSRSAGTDPGGGDSGRGTDSGKHRGSNPANRSRNAGNLGRRGGKNPRARK